MPEYLSPGVYVEDVSYRAKAIEGVSTFVLGVVIGVAAAVAVDRLRRRWSDT